MGLEKNWWISTCMKWNALIRHQLEIGRQPSRYHKNTTNRSKSKCSWYMTQYWIATMITRLTPTTSSKIDTNKHNFIFTYSTQFSWLYLFSIILSNNSKLIVSNEIDSRSKFKLIAIPSSCQYFVLLF